MLTNSRERELAPVHLIAYLTQKLLLMAIYEKWKDMSVTDVAKRLEVSKMSVSRCFDELEYLGIDVLGMRKKSRVINIPNDIQKLWNDTKDLLRSPVIKKYVLKEDIHLNRKAGISAISEYSLLSDNEYPTYAITKKEIGSSGIKNMKQVRIVEEIGCIIYEVGYFIDSYNQYVQDPFSVILGLTDEEKNDERVSISVKEMLEEYVWSKG